jgi:hypothetical protein
MSYKKFDLLFATYICFAKIGVSLRFINIELYG